MKSLFLALALALGCGGQEERNIEPEPAETRAEESAAEAEGEESAAEAEGEVTPTGTDAPPRPEEGATVASPGPVAGTPLTVQVERVRQESGAPGSEISAETEVLGSGVVRLEMDGYSAPCDRQIPFMAHLDGSVIRLYRAEIGPATRCVQTFDVTLSVGPLTTGEYTIELGRPGPNAEPRSIAEVTIDREGPEVDAPGDALAVSQTYVDPDERETQVGTPEALPAEGQQALRLPLHVGVVCTGDSTEVLFSAFRDGDRLVVRPHAPDMVARCAGPFRAYTLLIDSGEWMPTTIELQDRMGTKRLESTVGQP